MNHALFKKGNKCGVGHGRPKGSNWITLCRDWAEKKGWYRLINMAEGKGYSVEISHGRTVEIGPSLELQYQATRTLLEYGYGKPSQHVQLEAGQAGRMVLVFPTATSTGIEVATDEQ